MKTSAAFPKEAGEILQGHSGAQVQAVWHQHQLQRNEDHKLIVLSFNKKWAQIVQTLTMTFTNDYRQLLESVGKRQTNK